MQFLSFRFSCLLALSVLTVSLQLSCGRSDTVSADPVPTALDPETMDGPHLSEKPIITTRGRQLLVNGKPFVIKGVCYNPVPKGKSHPEGVLFVTPSEADLKALDKDFAMMKEAGINTLRTYVAIRDVRVLNLLNKHGLYVIVPVLNSTQSSTEKVRTTVEALKDHPSTLMWQVGNEWNYNKLYDDSISYEAAKKWVKSTGALIKSLDTTHPLSTDYGEVPPKVLVKELSDFDVWGLNIYAGKSFGDRFERWKAISDKPMYLGEFGADAINRDHVDLDSQAVATRELLEEIRAELSAHDPDNAVLGGSIFSWVDGWWKDPNGSWDKQDIGGNAPGGGPYPDGIFNEEYWGIVDINRNVRPAYEELKNIWAE